MPPQIISLSRLRRYFFALLILLFSSATLFSQDVPPGLNYQAFARDENGNPIANQTIVVEITILSESSGIERVEWQETHRIITEDTGFFSLIIGEGTPTMHPQSRSKFSDLSWGLNNFYLKVRVDFGAAAFGNGMIEMGKVKFQSVPYAFMAKKSHLADSALNVTKTTLAELIEVDTDTLSEGQIVQWGGENWTVKTVETGDLDAYIRHDGTTDLTGDWAIETNSISFTDGNITLTNGNVSLTEGNITLTNGTLQTYDLSIANDLQLPNSPVIRAVSTDTLMGWTNPSDNYLATQKAIRDYVQSSLSNSAWTSQGSKLYNVERDIGIGTSTPRDKFHAEVGSEGFLVTGQLGSASIFETGPGVRMAFYPSKAAFRAGGLVSNGDYWDQSNMGEYSAAFGRDNKAYGKFTAAFGISNIASGDRSFVSGRNNIASGTSSMAIGDGSESKGLQSVAFGKNTIAEKDMSFAYGEECVTKGIASFAGGYQNETQGKYSVAFGSDNMTMYLCESGFTTGEGNMVYGQYAVAMGYQTTAFSRNEFVIGQYNTGYNPGAAAMTNWRSGDRLFVIGNGSGVDGAADEFSDAMVMLKNGNTGLGISSPTVTLDVAGDINASGSVNQSSDARYKKNIKPIDNALSKVRQINGVYYNWRTDEFPQKKFGSEQQIGVIAQDIEIMFPELVTTDSNGYKSVNYAKLTPVLIEAVKEQQKQIETLQQKTNQLQTKIEKLQNVEAQIEALQKQVKKLSNTVKN